MWVAARAAVLRRARKDFLQPYPARRSLRQQQELTMTLPQIGEANTKR
jgi:hypothetical protein